MKSTNKEIIKASEKVPTLKSVMKFLGVVPEEGVFMGLALDTLPVMLNTFAHKACNIVVWNKRAKQGLQILKVMAEHTLKYRSQSRMVEFVVLTNNPEDWGELNEYGMDTKGNTSCIGIIPFYSDLSDQIILGLCAWINEKHNSSKAPVIVLLDGLENLENINNDFKLNFRYLTIKGYLKNVYVVATASKKNFHKVQEWMDGFQMEVYGCDFEHLFEYDRNDKKIYFFTPETEIV